MKTARTLVLLAVVQLALVGLYFAVESRRSTPAVFAVETLSEPVPALQLERDGQRIVPPTGAYLVHFWATWCGPCQEELPGLLAATQELNVPLVAVTDEPWPVLHRYFRASVPMSIVRDPTGKAAATWRVSGLPDTFVVRDGQMVARMGGPRDWHSAPARRFLRELRGR